MGHFYKSQVVGNLLAVAEGLPLIYQRNVRSGTNYFPLVNNALYKTNSWTLIFIKLIWKFSIQVKYIIKISQICSQIKFIFVYRPFTVIMTLNCRCRSIKWALFQTYQLYMSSPSKITKHEKFPDAHIRLINGFRKSKRKLQLTWDLV